VNFDTISMLGWTRVGTGVIYYLYPPSQKYPDTFYSHPKYIPLILFVSPCMFMVICNFKMKISNCIYIMILITNTGVMVVNYTWSGCVLYTDQWRWAIIIISHPYIVTVTGLVVLHLQVNFIWDVMWEYITN